MSATIPLPPWAQDALAHPPRAGEGVNLWLIKVAGKLRGWQSDPEIFDLLKSAVANCGRRVRDKEISRAVRRARTTRRNLDSLPAGALPASPAEPAQATWPTPDWQRIATVGADGTVEALKAASPMPTTGLTAGDVLRALWTDDTLVSIAKAHPWDAFTRPLGEWLGQDVGTNAFVVPSAMTAMEGTNQDGGPSLRCLDNTGPRQYLIVEFDFKTDGPAGEILNGRTTQDLCAALLLHLHRRGAPLALAVSSGGRSVHGWFPTSGAVDDALKPFFATACRLGADHATWTRCQLVRLPGGTRHNGRHQEILWCDVQHLARPQALGSRVIHHIPFAQARDLFPEIIPF